LNSKLEEPILLMKLPFKTTKSNSLNISIIFKIDFALTAMLFLMSKQINESYLEPSLIELSQETFKALLLSPWLTLGCEDHLLELILHWY
jgi:hypothetical protein